MNRKDFERLLQERILIFDGATGTNLQLHNPNVDDYAGKEGCTEILLETHPKWIEDLHASFFQAGCHVVETNSFGPNRIVFAEYGLEDRSHEFNFKSPPPARKGPAHFTTKAHPRYGPPPTRPPTN